MHSCTAQCANRRQEGCAVMLYFQGDDMVGAAGIEPATLGLEIRCSIRLSYAPALINTGEEAHCRNLRSLIAMPAVRIAHPTRPLPVGPFRARINLAWRSMRCSRDVIRFP